MTRPKYIASCSGGKDSVATLLLAAQHKEPLDEAVFSEVMFDQNTSGEVPEHRDFIYDRLKPFCEKELGIKFTILHADKTYDDVFHHVITRGPHKGEVRGFAWAGMCAVNRDCKIPPVRKYNAALSPDTVSYVGIAADEPKRIARLDGIAKVSLLAKYGMTEADAYKLCQEHGLLSPIYAHCRRNGCWFCPNASDEELLELIHRILEEKSKEEFIPLGEKAILGRELFNAFRKLDILQELIEDEEITEIMINGTQPIFIERNGRIYETDKKFLSKGKLEDVVQQMVAGCNRVVNEATPIVDARLEDGSRVNVVLPPVAINGPIVTIRKFPKSRITMETMIDTGSIGKEAAAMLIQAVKAKYNIFISGGTGSGKTTFLNVLSDFIPKEERIITIEDSAELQITGIPNLVRLEARNANVEGTGEINIRDLIRTALRMRPERIIVGEVRGEEALDMLQAFNTGHDGSISTGHANSPDDMMSRLSTMVLMGIKLPLEAVMRQIASGIDILVHLGRLRDKSRKVLEIMEVLGYEKGEIRLQPLFSFQETGSKDGKIQGEWVKRSTLTRTEKLMAAGYQPEGVCPGDNGKHSSGVSDRHAVLFKTMDDGSAFSSGNEVLRKDDPSGGGKREETF